MATAKKTMTKSQIVGHFAEKFDLTRKQAADVVNEFAELAVAQGAAELDMVMNIGALKSGAYDYVEEDIRTVTAAAGGKHVKVIIETGALTEGEKVTAAKLVADSGADFVKTCTGFGPGRATVHDIALIKETVGDRISVKASGGVAGIEDGIAFMRAGATVVAFRRMLVDQLEALGWRG